MILPVPERWITVVHQLGALSAGKRLAVLVPDSDPLDCQEFTQTVTDAGTFFHNCDEQIIRDAVGSGEYYRLLGHIEPKSPHTTRVIVAWDADGNEIQSSLVSPQYESAQCVIFHGMYPGCRIEAGGLELCERVLAFRS